MRRDIFRPSRRSLIAGAGAAIIARPSFAQRILLGQQPATSSFFTNVGSSQPVSNNVAPAQIYDSGQDLLSILFEGYYPQNTVANRAPMAVMWKNASNPATRKCYGPYVAGVNNVLANTDQHGIPVLAGPDSNGYYYCLYGAHEGAMNVSSTIYPNDLTQWKAAASVGVTTMTFPRLFLNGSTAYLFYTAPGTGTGAEGSLSLLKGTINAGGTITWAAPGTAKSLFDLSNGGAQWTIPGNFLASPTVPTDIHMTFAYFSLTPSQRTQNVFYAIYDMTTGNVRNLSGGTSIATASQPVVFSTALANFAPVDQTTPGRYGGVPYMAFDGSGNSGILYTDSTAKDSAGANVLFITGPQGGSWSSPQTIKVFGSTYSVTNMVGGCVTTASDGGFDIWIGDGTSNQTYAANNPGFTSAGNMQKYHRDTSGVLTGPFLQLSKGSFPLDVPSPITNGQSFARICIPEISNGALPYQTNIIPGLKVTVMGDNAIPLVRVFSPLNPLTQDLIAQFTAPPTASFTAAIDALINSLYASGIWWSLTNLYIMCANDTQSARLNWVDPNHYALTDGGTGSPTFTRLVGFTTSGANYLNTGFNPAAPTFATGTQKGSISLCSLSAYWPSLVGTTNEVGAFSGSSGVELIVTSTQQSSRLAMSGANVNTVGNGIGFYSASRTNSTTLVTQCNGVQGGQGIGGGTFASTNIVAGGISSASLTTQQVGMLQYGGNISAAMMLTFEASFRAYLAAIANL